MDRAPVRVVEAVFALGMFAMVRHHVPQGKPKASPACQELEELKDVILGFGRTYDRLKEPSEDRRSTLQPRSIMTKKTSLCQGDTNRRRRGARGDPRLKGQRKMARRVLGYRTTELTRGRSQILSQFKSEVTPHKTLGHELPVLIIEAEDDVNRLTRGVSTEVNPQPPDQLA